MNLSPVWESTLSAAAIEATHWSRIGKGDAPDSEIMAYARENGFIVLTHDLDFGTLLAHSRDHKPSVVQLRGQEVTPALMGSVIIAALSEFEDILEQGALVTIEPDKTRARVLPL